MNATNSHGLKVSLMVLFAGSGIGLAGIAGADIIPTNALDLTRIGYRVGGNDPNAGLSRVGELNIDVSAIGSSSQTRYLNIIDDSRVGDDRWIVRNQPVFASGSEFSGSSLAVNLDLTGIGAVDGVPLNPLATTNWRYDFSSGVTPATGGIAESIGDVLGRGLNQLNRTVNAVINCNAVGAVGGGTVIGVRRPPNPGATAFNALFGGNSLRYQPGHDNIQSAVNQCAPAAIANSLSFQRATRALTVPEANALGFKGDATLVGVIDTKTNRTVAADRFTAPGSTGVWPMDGLIDYIADSPHNLVPAVQVKHLVGGTAGNGGAALNGGANYVRRGVTSTGGGAAFNIAWIIAELAAGASVSLDLAYDPGDGTAFNQWSRHYVQVLGAGMVGGQAFLMHSSDICQADLDLIDAFGTSKVNFEWVDNATGLAIQSNAIIDQVISIRAVPAPGAAALMGLGLVFASRRRRQA